MNYLWDETSLYGDVVLETTSGINTSYALAGSKLISQTRNGSTSFYLQDGQGSTRNLIDSTGNVTDSYSYTAFGEIYSQVGTTENKYLYTGQQYDAETNLYSLRARYYNPASGRFLSQDTYAINFNNPIELNRYGYAANSPISLSDPSGHAAFAEYALKGALIGGIVFGVTNYAYQAYNYGSNNVNLREVLGFTIAGMIIGASIGLAIAAWSIGTTTTLLTGEEMARASCGGDCSDEIANLTQKDIPAVQQFVQNAAQRNVERGYGTFGSLWDTLSKFMINTGNTANIFVQRVGNRITGMMKVSTDSGIYEIKYLEGVGGGAGTNLFMRAIQDSIARGFGGSIYLDPAPTALNWYITNFPGAVQLPNGLLYWSSEAAKAILGN